MARNFASDTPPQVVSLSSSAQVLNLSSYAFICWFKAASAANYRYITAQEANFNEQMFIRLNTDGTVNFWHRTPSAIIDITSGSSYDDGAWHWLLLLRRSSADFQAYIDGSSVGTSTNNPSTISVSPTVVLGDYVSGDEPLRGDLARCILLTAAVEVDEARSIAYTGRTLRTIRFWHELSTPGSSTPDWSGNGYNGTVTGATMADHPPVAFPWSSLSGTTNISVGSASVSPSASTSPSASPSAGYTGYTRGNYAALPANDADLSTSYSAGDVTDVATNNEVRVDQSATGEYMVHQYKDFVNGSSACTLTWEGQSTLAPSTSAVVLQIYNQNSTTWETLDSDNATSASTDFTLTANIADLTNYKTAQNTISSRIYQANL